MSMFYCSGCDHLVDSDATLFIVEEGKNGVDEWICEPCLERDNPDHAEEHPVMNACIAVAPDIGFCWNEETESYDLYSDEQTWSLNVPPSRFMDKVNQQYSRMLLHSAVKEQGFEVEEEWEMDDNSIEMTVTRWIS